MRKRKIYEISVIDKTYSKIISDETKFYTSDTALELVFKLKETEYNFESAEIVLLNIDDRSLVTRPVVKNLDSFAYELDDDIIPHYGKWHGQLRFEAGEIYVSSPVKFRIENDLSNERPPQLSDVQSWVSLKRYADGLVDELKQSVLSIDGIEDTFNANETIRTETFNANETTRQENETARQQAESQRQSMFEANESERQTIFETAEQERQSAELIRIENEKQRNLTSVDEFVKLQDAVGGRNLLVGSGNVKLKPEDTFLNYKYLLRTNIISITSKVKVGDSLTFSFDVWSEETTNISIYDRNDTPNINFGEHILFSNPEKSRVSFTTTLKESDNSSFNNWVMYFYNNNNGVKFWIENIKIEKGTQATPYTKAPEDYTVVSKEDYYNHIKLMNEFKDSQFNKLKQAVLALGGTI